MISAFDIFKIGIGPSSSHTVGPMNAGKSFIDRLESSGLLTATSHIVVDLYGSLSLTGKGHATDVAIIMGLAGNSPQDVVIDEIPAFIELVTRSGRLPVASGAHIVDFPVAKNIIFHPEMLPRHENGMRITAWKGQEALLSKTYYSVGGGFIVEEEHFGLSHDVETSVPYDFHSAGELLKMCDYNGLSISGLMMHNELALRSKAEIDAGFARIWQVMHDGIERGMNTEGVLPGPLNVPRRAVALRRQLVSSDNISNDPMNVIDWINMYALAVSEENAAGGRVVTAPTNGACGIIPAVLAYYDKFRRPVNERSIARYFLAAGAIGATLEKQCERGLLAKDLSSSIVIRTSAASDARMGGATLPAMSNSGSGNQGITATMPVVVVAEHFGADDERLARALMLSHLSAIYIHNQLPRLSALCAATTAAMGAAAGMAWLVDGRYETISMAISSMIGDVSGMICDGASNSCAMKVSTSASAAWKAVLMALDDTAVTGNEGIVAHDVEQSIANLCALASHSMQQTDRQIIEIMASKAR
ncbi:L-serine ammonia-lyase [Escherichia coli]|nr:L-serine ammonia-lyase [Escherichia coli]